MDAAGIDDAHLRDPDMHLPVAAEFALWHAMARDLPDPAFGIQSAASLRVRQFGLLGYVVSFSATLRDALRRLQRYGRVLTAAVEFVFQELPSQVGLVVCHPALGPGPPIAQDYRLAAVVQLSREVTGAEIVPRAVDFAYLEPSDVSAHRRFFRCPLAFDARTARVVFHEGDLDRSLVRADEALAGYLSSFAEQVLASLVRGGTVRHSVRAVVWSLLGDGPPSLLEVAAALRTSPRTLQRRLADEGTSLQAEIDEIRRTMALAVLRDQATAIEEVAVLLGYEDPSTFFRSFKRWTGTTPRRFRQSAR